MTNQFRRKLLASTLFIGAASLASQAMAQDAAAPQDAAEEAPTGDDIIVTGSLITNPNLERSSPVNVTTSEEIELLQSNVAEEILRELPGVTPSMGSAVNNGNAGAAYVDLRGLGSNRNIVLLDGVRIVPATISGRVDLNNIPLALVERVDALTGGASTTYGADAISGVVNFITKSDFAGAEISASEQITERGDGNVFRIDATIGANFDDGRGNAVFSVGYQQADAVFQGDRDISLFARSSTTVDPTDPNRGAKQGSGTSVPTTVSGAGPSDLQIDPATGRLVPTYNSFNFSPYNAFQTPFERYNMFGSARYEISDSVEIYTRGLFSKNTVNVIVAPSGAFFDSFLLPISNPYLPTAARNQICATADFNPSTTAIETLTQAQCDAAAAATSASDPNYREASVDLTRRMTEAGPRISEFITNVFDYKLGFRGAVNDSIDWDIFGSYGESRNVQTLENYISLSRLQQSLRAFNQTTCAAATFANCVPINMFGPEGSITPAMVDPLKVKSTSFAETSLAQVRGTISGDFGATLPSASDPISFALGGEYRKYNAKQGGDTLATAPGELGGAGGATAEIDGTYDVYEAFAEIVAPLVQDKPFFESLTFEAGIRYSAYKIYDTPNRFKTTTWKAGGSWEPGAGVKFRGNFSHAVRAPNVAELFTPVTTQLTNLADDPCASRDAAGNPIPGRPAPTGFLQDVCIAQGAPVTSIGLILQPSAGQSNYTGGGNINLKPEVSDSYTIGVVFQPDFIPGLSLSLDYYNINIDGAISYPAADDAIDACFGNLTAASATDPACTRIRRTTTGGRLSGGTVPGLFFELTNEGRRFTDGLDFTANYKRDLGFAQLGMSFVANYVFSSTFKARADNPDGLNRECVGYYSINCSPPTGLIVGGSLTPEFQFSQRTTLSFEDIDVSLLWRHMSPMQVEPSQASKFVAAYRNIDAYDNFDLSVRFAVSENVTITGTVANLLDKQPPEVGNTIGTTAYNSGNTFPSSYDSLGRRYAISARLKF